jgi:hypothetical protein
MNYNNVVSFPAAVDLSGKEHVSVKLTSTGVDIAGAGDVVIGTLIRGAVTGKAADVFLTKGNGFRFVQVGNPTAIPVGALLEQAASGTYVLKTTGATAGYAVEAAPSGSNGGGMIRAIIL